MLAKQIAFTFSAKTNLIFWHGEVEVFYDRLQFDAHCGLDLGPCEHLEDVNRVSRYNLLLRFSLFAFK